MNVLITAIIAAITTAIGSTLGYLFARKKYRAEVDSIEIKNLKDSIEIYKGLVEDCNKRVSESTKMFEDNKTEVLEYKAEVCRLQDMVYRLLKIACLDAVCPKRQLYSDAEVKEILMGLNSNEDNINKQQKV